MSKAILLILFGIITCFALSAIATNDKNEELNNADYAFIPYTQGLDDSEFDSINLDTEEESVESMSNEAISNNKLPQQQMIANEMMALTRADRIHRIRCRILNRVINRIQTGIRSLGAFANYGFYCRMTRRLVRNIEVLGRFVTGPAQNQLIQTAQNIRQNPQLHCDRRAFRRMNNQQRAAAVASFRTSLNALAQTVALIGQGVCSTTTNGNSGVPIIG